MDKMLELLGKEYKGRLELIHFYFQNQNHDMDLNMNHNKDLARLATASASYIQLDSQHSN